MVVDLFKIFRVHTCTCTSCKKLKDTDVMHSITSKTIKYVPLKFLCVLTLNILIPFYSLQCHSRMVFETPIIPNFLFMLNFSNFIANL